MHKFVTVGERAELALPARTVDGVVVRRSRPKLVMTRPARPWLRRLGLGVAAVAAWLASFLGAGIALGASALGLQIALTAAGAVGLGLAVLWFATHNDTGGCCCPRHR